VCPIVRRFSGPLPSFYDRPAFVTNTEFFLCVKPRPKTHSLGLVFAVLRGRSPALACFRDGDVQREMVRVFQAILRAPRDVRISR
jgi:hypothetical protein